MKDIATKMQEWADTILTLYTALEMIENGASAEAVTEFLKMACHFFGKNQVINTIKDNKEFKPLKQFI